jgi:hypothetical protein
LVTPKCNGHALCSTNLLFATDGHFFGWIRLPNYFIQVWIEKLLSVESVSSLSEFDETFVGERHNL